MFDELKVYLQIPHVLIAPMPGDTLELYLGVTKFSISGVMFKEQDKVEKSTYYISQTLQLAETRYLPIEWLGLLLSLLLKNADSISKHNE